MLLGIDSRDEHHLSKRCSLIWCFDEHHLTAPSSVALPEASSIFYSLKCVFGGVFPFFWIDRIDRIEDIVHCTDLRDLVSVRVIEHD